MKKSKGGKRGLKVGARAAALGEHRVKVRYEPVEVEAPPLELEHTDGAAAPVAVVSAGAADVPLKKKSWWSWLTGRRV